MIGIYPYNMELREQWGTVLEAEVRHWKTKSFTELLDELADQQAYEVGFEGGSYQIEVSVLEKKQTYIHVVVSVDDGSLPASLRPRSESFIKPKS